MSPEVHNSLQNLSKVKLCEHQAVLAGVSPFHQARHRKAEKLGVEQNQKQRFPVNSRTY